MTRGPLPLDADEEILLSYTLSPAARGAHFTLRVNSWKWGPLSKEKLAKFAGVHRGWTAIWKEIQSLWSEQPDGTMTCSNVEKLRSHAEHKRSVRATSGRDGAIKRHSGMTFSSVVTGNVPSDANAYVYFAQRADGRVKIGITTRLRRRLAEISVASRTAIRLLAAIPGDGVIERSLHERFATAREEGEWFAPCPELMQFINDLHGERP